MIEMCEVIKMMVTPHFQVNVGRLLAKILIGLQLIQQLSTNKQHTCPRYDT